MRISAWSSDVCSSDLYRLTDRLRLTCGIRYTWDKRTIDRHGIEDWRLEDPICQVGENAGLPASVAECTNRESAKFKYPAWLASVDYELTPAIFLYAKTSGASMSGGFHSRNVPAPYRSFFDPAKLRDVELGFKNTKEHTSELQSLMRISYAV